MTGLTRQARAAWLVVALTVVLAAVHSWLFLGWSEVHKIPGWPVLPVGSVLISWLGALIVTRLPGHRIGWLFVITGVAVATSDVLAVHGTVLEAEGLQLPRALDVVVSWFTFFLDLPVPGLLLTLMFLLFPDGHLPGRRWRLVLWAAWTTFGLFVVMTVAIVRPESFSDTGQGRPLTGLSALVFVSLAISVLLEAVAAAGACLVRLRGREGHERQQLQWVAAAAFAATCAFGFSLFGEVMGLHGTVGTWVRTTPLHLAFVAIPVTAGLAILRHRLYDIDVILNRAIVLTVLTAFVAGGYIAVVVTIDSLLGQRADERFWPSLLAFVLVAVAFQWVRRSVLGFADRLVYGRRAAPYEALADFSSGVSHAPSTTELLPLVAEAVGRSVGARRTTISLDVGSAKGLGAPSSTYPPQASPLPSDAADVVIEVRDRDLRVGDLRLVVDRPLTSEQQRLADDLAGQAAMALRNLRMESELSAQVDELSVRTAELEDSRRRLLAARDDERNRLAGALRREVVRHLDAMPDDLERLAGEVHRKADAISVHLDEHITTAGAALEELRAISRGLVPPTPTPRRGVLGRTRPS